MRKITGKDLIDAGYEPAPWFKEALDILNPLPWEDQFEVTDEVIKATCDKLLPPPVIMPHKSPRPYSFNMSPSDNADEIANMEKVRQTMDELMKVPTIREGAVMPDACPTGKIGQIPVGGVVIAENAIHPNMHSADICCSVMATDLGEVDPKHVMDVAMYATHFGYGGRNDGIYQLTNDLKVDILTNPYLNHQDTVVKSTTHLGTQGDGNHFLFVGKSEASGNTILVTHHGSRGVGADLFKRGMKVAEKFRKKISPDTDKINAWIPYDTDEGRDYWSALQIVRKWTKLNHEVIHDKIADIVGGNKDFKIWNEHNFVFKDGNDFYHAKGATPLKESFVPDGAMGLRLIPLNMSEPILVVKGYNYCSGGLGFAPHGAGRNISRSEHKRRMDAIGLSKKAILFNETKGLDIRFFSGKADLSELPSAYKSADDVQRQMKDFDLGTVVNRIMPYGSIMAGEQDAPWRKKGKKG
ncbi:MAG: RtcB family protein [Elainellaceae cyanobacterium]